ncbi:MAG: DUF6527 family protein [Bacteroidota bacterium]
MKIINHKFVELIPEHEDMEDGVIYISLNYDTAIHNCICGCGEQVVTPLSPTDWRLTYDGESVSLHPSIGNWEFDCKSHYWIRKGKIIWGRMWSEQKVRSGKETDQKEKAHYYEQKDDENKETLYHKLEAFLNKLLRW